MINRPLPQGVTLRYKGTPGEAYRPSNGTEGAMFEEIWCLRCKKDQDWQEHEKDSCPILLRALKCWSDDPDYPKEWAYQEDGAPCCTAFEEIPEVER